MHESKGLYPGYTYFYWSCEFYDSRSPVRKTPPCTFGRVQLSLTSEKLNPGVLHNLETRCSGTVKQRRVYGQEADEPLGLETIDQPRIAFPDQLGAPPPPERLSPYRLISSVFDTEKHDYSVRYASQKRVRLSLAPAESGALCIMWSNSGHPFCLILCLWRYVEHQVAKAEASH